LNARPAYKPEYCELAHNYCLLGATAEVLAGFFGVTRGTINNWIATHPDFSDAVYRGRAAADAVVVRALFERAKGFSHKVSRTTLYRGEERTITNTVSYPPDTQACMFWLRNRQRQYWQAKAEATPEGSDDMEARLDAAGRACAMPVIERALPRSGRLAETRATIPTRSRAIFLLHS
jgi:hypothetical protein